MYKAIYPQEIREQIVAAYDSGTPVHQRTAAFGIHFNTVYRFLKARRLTGSFARVPPRKGGAKPLLDSSQKEVLAQLQKENPEVTNAQMIELIFEKTGIRMTEATMWRNLKALGF